MNTKSAVAVLASCCLLAACVVNQNFGSQYAKQQTVQALQGGTVTVTDQDDRWLEGTAIQIPPSALTVDTKITIAEGKDLTAVPTGAIAVSHAAIFGPAATEFTHPTTVTLKLTDSTHDVSGLIVVGVADDGTTLTVAGKDLLINTTSSIVAFTTRKLIHYQLHDLDPALDRQVRPQRDLLRLLRQRLVHPRGPGVPAALPRHRVRRRRRHRGRHGRRQRRRRQLLPGQSVSAAAATSVSASPMTRPARSPARPRETRPPARLARAPRPRRLSAAVPARICAVAAARASASPIIRPAPLACPVCDPTTTPTPCGCLPPGAACGCDPSQPSTVPCQCDPTTAVSNGGTTTGGTAIVCSVDGGSVCPAGEYLSPCGCVPRARSACLRRRTPASSAARPRAPRRAATASAPAPMGSAKVCFADGGTGTVDGGVCPFGTARCFPGGPCQPSGLSCPAPDAGGAPEAPARRVSSDASPPTRASRAANPAVPDGRSLTRAQALRPGSQRGARAFSCGLRCARVERSPRPRPVEELPARRRSCGARARRDDARDSARRRVRPHRPQRRGQDHLHQGCCSAVVRPSCGDRARARRRSPEDPARPRPRRLPARAPQASPGRPAVRASRSVAAVSKVKRPVGAARGLEARLELRRPGTGRHRALGGYSKGMRQRAGARRGAARTSPSCWCSTSRRTGIDPLGRPRSANPRPRSGRAAHPCCSTRTCSPRPSASAICVGILHQGRLVRAGTLDELKRSASGWTVSFAPGANATKLAALGFEAAREVSACRRKMRPR